VEPNYTLRPDTPSLADSEAIRLGLGLPSRQRTLHGLMGVGRFVVRIALILRNLLSLDVFSGVKMVKNVATAGGIDVKKRFLNVFFIQGTFFNVF